MCGIGGVLRVWRSAGEAPPSTFDAIPEAWLDVLDESVKHRGPDGRGRFRQRIVRPSGEVVDVALIHRRLSIIDHAGGAQPMVLGAPTRPSPSPGLQSGVPSTSGAIGLPPTEVGGSESECLISREGAPYEPLRAHTCPKCGPGVVAVVFNGCIYNHRELRRELEAAGHEFFTDHSDTEVLLHGWREWGGGIPDRLNSMHAFALWDETSVCRWHSIDEVVIERDAAGQKPVYRMLSGLGWGAVVTTAFGSSWAGLYGLASRITPRGNTTLVPNRRLVRHWVRFGYGETPIRQIRLVDPPYLRSSTVQALRHPCGRSGGACGAADLEKALMRAVKRHFEADVPIGCFLSGGVDSSLIAALARESRSDLFALTVRMPDPRYDESRIAQHVAQHIRVRHVIVDVTPNPADDLVRLVHELGLPFGDSSLLPTHWISRAARDVVGVAVSGEGGDELFVGYDRYRAADLLHRHRDRIRRIPPGLPMRDPKSRSSKLARLCAAARSDNANDLAAVFPTEDIQRLWPFKPDKRGWPMFRPDGARLRMSDLTNYLPDDLLRKVDTASMSVALEVRAPFLDGELIRLVTSIPYNQLCPRGQRKGLLRAVARRYLPAEIVDRPKMGFAIPIGEWFRTDYGGMRQLLYDHLESADPFPGLAEAGVEINMDFVRRMLREHDAAGEKSINPWHGRDHSQRLYMLLVLSIWCGWLRGLRGGE
ncbi:MAG: asparagine synthase (glutamine-hydrolyzing) [Phycisphaeraceae bacterium]|nr:asparagine synthase (glutamine-hydrolyzing) [Phycisphaeraceae bacterium]